jgi:hypothetical protein
MMKKLILILFSLLLINSFAFAQMSGNLDDGNSSSGNTVTLSIHCNVQGAAIHISGGDIIGTKVGYADFSIELSPGTYTVEASADGYQSQTRTVRLRRDQSISFNLSGGQPVQHDASLTVRSNVGGAHVSIWGNGVSEEGSTTMRVDLPPGNYTVEVSKHGYITQTRQITMNRSNQTLDFSLEQERRDGTLIIILPDDIMNGNPNSARGRIQVYDNGRRLNSRDFTFDLSPGEHTIRIVSGGFATETTLHVRGGETYQLEPVFYLQQR